MPRFHNLKGRKYDRLTVLDSYISEPTKKHAGSRIKWLCRCDCGSEIYVYSDNLSRSHTTSCGCKPRKARHLPGIAPANELYCNYITGAKKRKMEFKLTKEEFRFLIQQNCFFCGIKPSNVKICVRETREDVLYYNGIDRLDNNIGYIIENCVSCCKQCNMSKKSYTKEEFLNWIKRVYEYNYGR